MMNELLRSPFTIGLCTIALLAWILTLLAIFWPSKGRQTLDTQRKDERDAGF